MVPHLSPLLSALDIETPSVMIYLDDLVIPENNCDLLIDSVRSIVNSTLGMPLNPDKVGCSARFPPCTAPDFVYFCGTITPILTLSRPYSASFGGPSEYPLGLPIGEVVEVNIATVCCPSVSLVYPMRHYAAHDHIKFCRVFKEILMV